MTTRHGDFALGDAERFGDQGLQRAVGFVVFGRGANAGLEIRAVIVRRAAFDAVAAAGWGKADAQTAQRKPRVPSSMPSIQ